MTEDAKKHEMNQMDDELQRELDEALGEMSLDQLIEAEEASAAAAQPQKGATKRGRVISVQKDSIFVDMGGKTQGVLPATQFSEDEPLPKEGDIIEFTIEGYDKQDGLLLLSREGAVMAAAWGTLEEGQTLEGRVTGHNKGGLELVINGIKAFMPISQVELFRVEDLSPYVGQKMTVQVIEVNPEDHKLVVSRRNVLQVEAEANREKMWETFVEGQTVTGTVRSIMPYGAFVSLGNNVDGLLHVKDMSYSRVEDPSKIVKEGQKLEVMILKVDHEARKLSLGLKQVMPDPWEGVESKWAVDSVVSGRVTRLADFGAFIELEPGVEGLVPMGEMSFTRRVKTASEVVNAGDVVKVRVMSVDAEKKRISLSLKRVGDDPWMGASARWSVGSIVTGIVTRTTDFGAFIELTSGVEGLVHISELSYERVRAVADAVQPGQTVQAKVLEVDEDRKRISLSIKQLQTMAEYTGPASAEPSAEEPKPQPKRKKPLKGGLD